MREGLSFERASLRTFDVANVAIIRVQVKHEYRYAWKNKQARLKASPMKIQIPRCKKFCILSIFVLSGFVLSGCAAIPEVINLKQDESFTYDEIVAGMMGVGGVISIVNDLDESESSKYAAILRDSFLSVREEFVILPGFT